MRYYLIILAGLFLLTSCRTQQYYIVRHAEKQTGNAAGKDPSLTEQGRKRALDLMHILESKKIGGIYSTNTKRTRETAEPTRAHFSLETQTYAPLPDSAFITHLKSGKKNVLIVGHSNTVDDIVNRLTGKNHLTDLPDSAYNHLFIVTKKGKKMLFTDTRYGE